MEMLQTYFYSPVKKSIRNTVFVKALILLCVGKVVIFLDVFLISVKIRRRAGGGRKEVRGKGDREWGEGHCV